MVCSIALFWSGFIRIGILCAGGSRGRLVGRLLRRRRRRGRGAGRCRRLRSRRGCARSLAKRRNDALLHQFVVGPGIAGSRGRQGKHIRAVESACPPANKANENVVILGNKVVLFTEFRHALEACQHWCATCKQRHQWSAVATCTYRLVHGRARLGHESEAFVLAQPLCNGFEAGHIVGGALGMGARVVNVQVLVQIKQQVVG